MKSGGGWQGRILEVKYIKNIIIILSNGSKILIKKCLPFIFDQCILGSEIMMPTKP